MPDLVSRVGVTTIPIQCSLLQSAQQEQSSKMMARSSRPLESYLENIQQEFYSTGIKELFDKCNICIAVKGDYIE